MVPAPDDPAPPRCRFVLPLATVVIGAGFMVTTAALADGGSVVAAHRPVSAKGSAAPAQGGDHSTDRDTGAAGLEQ